MARLLIHVEGPTEEDFVNQVLRDHLLSRGYVSVGARIVGNARLRRQRGGIRPWPSVRRDIINHLLQDQGCIATTMVDYYGLPQTGDGAWPGRAEASRLGTVRNKAQCVEDAALADLIREMGGGLFPQRFMPFIVMHEFEGLLFSDCEAFSRGLYSPNLESEFRRIRDQFATPEDIDDSPLTTPSRRVQALVPRYEKPLFGTLAALEVGLNRIRAECAHFDSWLQSLESLVR